ncbi:hypothetical protein IAG44_35065 [Streptomyces roseirectus]|uniref:HD domain-containing protein n=1 Tax=Streptomyces roseirectus TaxID=2768066 RepID=A0A7H0IMZ7_9ACTN|nr:hypothetical protein [Streptomyces roseirectus]QNP74163.1 hypothetical protein IAG44_35065 [Streptomyces roseirectus]
MELRSVEELMDLLYACRGVRAPGATADLHDLALRTAALLRRGRPADKELQLAGLVHPVGHVLCPADPARRADRTADAVRPLLGPRVAALLRRHPRPAHLLADDDLARLAHAAEEARGAGFDAGVLEDWRTVLHIVAGRNSPLGAVD